jgi:ATP-binding cassette subfamily G (WHITE) protein 2 (SNQ2)
MVSTELYELPVRCLANEFSVFTPPAGQSCQDWAGPFVSSAGGYLNNPDATSNCQYCIYAVSHLAAGPVLF